MALLGELHLMDGDVRVQGRIAYASQQSWVFSASVRQNITFGQAFDASKYKRVIQAAALSKVRTQCIAVVTSYCHSEQLITLGKLLGKTAGCVFAVNPSTFDAPGILPMVQYNKTEN